jgi:hypothetical protein
MSFIKVAVLEYGDMHTVSIIQRIAGGALDKFVQSHLS